MSSSSPKRSFETPAAFKELWTPSRYKAFWGGRGGGKSRAFGRALLLKSLDQPLRILCAREIQKSISDSVKRLLDDDIERMGLGGFFDSTLSEIRTAIGGLFIFAGLRSNIETVKSTEGVDIAWLEEANAISQASMDVLIPTIRKEGSEIWVSWNPKSIKDPVDKMFRGGTPPPDSIIRKVTWEHNPWFPEVLRKEMEWDRQRDPEKYAHVWLGEYLKNSEARVFRNWRIDTFEVPKGARPYFGGDWGFAIDPSVLVRCWIVGRTLYIDREAYEVGCPIDKTPALFDTIDDARKWPITADSARPETIDYMRRHGYPHIQGARKGPGSIEDGVEFLKSFDIVVHPDCAHMVDELTLYSYKVDKLTGEVLPVLEDKKNHCIAEGELVECIRGQVPIESVAVGDMVLTRAGYRRVLFSDVTDVNRDTVRVKTTRGSVICTPDHEVYTAKGFVRADALRYGDEVINLEHGEWSSGLYGKAEHIVATLKASGRLIERTLDGWVRGARIFCTEMFGRTPTAPCLTGMKYITSMGTQQTTRFQTWPVCGQGITGLSTPGATSAGNRKTNFSTESAPSRKRGTRARRAFASTKRLVAWLIGRSCQPKRNAGRAGYGSHQERSGTKIYSAQTHASQRTGARLAPTTWTEFAQHAGQCFGLIATQRPRLVRGHVETVTEHGRCARVYDLTVDGQHEFFAGGVLVSNCIDSLRYAAEGVRVMDGGMVYATPETDIIIPSIKLPSHWAKAYALDIDGATTSCLWGAVDNESGTLYIYAEYTAGRSELALVADAVRQRGSWIPGLFDHLSRNRSKPEGQRITEALLDLKLDIFTVQADPEAAISEVSRRLSTKRIKVFDTCTNWAAQYRAYRRDKDGDLVEESDGLMRCMDLLALSGREIAASDGAAAEQAKDEWSEHSRDSMTGY